MQEMQAAGRKKESQKALEERTALEAFRAAALQVGVPSDRSLLAVRAVSHLAWILNAGSEASRAGRWQNQSVDVTLTASANQYAGLHPCRGHCIGRVWLRSWTQQGAEKPIKTGAREGWRWCEQSPFFFSFRAGSL